MIKIGHRGASGYSPENTFLSFEKAIDCGVDMIELDIHVCKSGELVVIHDDTIDRTSNSSGLISNINLNELKKIDILKGGKISTLMEVLDYINKRVNINIELKGEGTVEKVAKILTNYVLHNNWEYDNFFISSFRHKDLIDMNKILPKVKISPLIGHLPLDNAKFAEGLPYYSLNIDYNFTNVDFIIDAHKKGFKVFVYTVDDSSMIKKLKEMKVDGIISNFPDRL